MRIIFMGSDPIALPLLEVLKSKCASLALITGEDRRIKGRVTPGPVAQWALERGVELWRTPRLSDELLAKAEDWRPDATLVMAYGEILKRNWLELPRLGTWNIHASLLPQLRGASPIETALALRKEKTGVCLMKMVPALDAGPVAAFREILLGESLTGPQLRQEVARHAAALMEECWQAWTAGAQSVVPQDDSRATYCRLLSARDRWIDFAQAPEDICARIRALAERVGAVFSFRMSEAINVYAAREAPGAPEALPGTVLEAKNRLIIAVGGLQAVELLELQRPGGKRLLAADFLRGYPVQAGQRVIFGAHRPLEDCKPFPRDFESKS